LALPLDSMWEPLWDLSLREVLPQLLELLMMRLAALSDVANFHDYYQWVLSGRW
jgi:hypothetical protein